MKQTIGGITLLVRDYDEALAYYCEKLGFDLLEDTALDDGKRWVLVVPPGSTGSPLLLAQAATPEQQASIGNQAGGRVFLFLHTDDFWSAYRRMEAQGVQFLEEPRHEPYGWVVVFADCYGNKWDLLGPAAAEKK
ncbi:VOC family protein [Hymenobacter profundi]|uniref:VOC family protein n=1 Tax=Hymenobacter profundi TaxID=1982110 RepID=A0ABS6X3B5_9BACT|nr:VOC family protein [Hymenobacter profundi]MBW3130308.1 VOC family protein [Hymenobacter profundi]